MLLNILTHTPLYVWVILALLVIRGVGASRDREMAFYKLVILPILLPLAMLAELTVKYGLGSAALPAWAAGAAVAGIATWKLSGARISAGKQAGKVLVRGSWLLLAVLMTVFLTKYVATVALLITPHLRAHMLFMTPVCLMYGVCNGILLARLARDWQSWHQLREHGALAAAVAAT